MMNLYYFSQFELSKIILSGYYIERDMYQILNNIIQKELKCIYNDEKEQLTIYENDRLYDICGKFYKNIQNMRKEFLYRIIKKMFSYADDVNIKKININQINKIYVFDKKIARINWGYYNFDDFFEKHIIQNIINRHLEFRFKDSYIKTEDLVSSLLLLILDIAHLSYKNLFSNIYDIVGIIVYNFNNIDYCYCKYIIYYFDCMYYKVNDFESLNNFIVEYNYYNPENQIVGI